MSRPKSAHSPKRNRYGEVGSDELAYAASLAARFALRLPGLE